MDTYVNVCIYLLRATWRNDETKKKGKEKEKEKEKEKKERNRDFEKQRGERTREGPKDIWKEQNFYKQRIQESRKRKHSFAFF